MSNLYIKSLYRDIYGEEFNYGDFGKRMKMQKCIYLAEQFGINVGEYAFSWYKHGPYSQRLQDDMYEESGKATSQLYYSEFALNVINRLKELVKKAQNEDFGYTVEQWMECLASIHYLNRLFNGNKQKTLKTLVERKAHLNNSALNDEAYKLVTSVA